MTEFLRNNQIALRDCILYEFAGGKPVFESYKNLCERIGDDAIDYVDFEYWFMRFANGNFDLNHDRSLGPKTPSLPDMPIHIFEKIVNEVELMDRFAIRKVSKYYQYIIDNILNSGRFNPKFRKIHIEIHRDATYLYYVDKCDAHRNEVCYFQRVYDTKDDCVVEYGKRETVIKSENHLKLALDDLAIVLKNPKLQLDELNVSSFNDTCIPEFESMIKSLNRNLHVKKFSFIATLRNMNGAMTILPYLETEALEEIVLDIKFFSYNEKQIEGDEWNTAMVQLGALVKFCEKTKMLTLMTDMPPDRLPIESFLQLRRFTIDFRCVHVTQTTALRFTKILLKSTVLEYAHLKRNINTPTFLKQLGGRAVLDHPNARRLPIPKSNEFFEIEVQEKSVCIKRIS